MSLYRKFYTVLCFSLMFPGMVTAQEIFQSERVTFRVRTVIDRLDHPWGMAFLPDGGMLITEKTGRLRLVRAGILDPLPVEGLPAVREYGQGGLLDVALHPQFTSNRWIYLSFAAAGAGGYGTEVVRGKLDGRELKEVTSIFTALPKVGGGRHFGSRLLFAPDGSLLISLGERGDQDLAQDLSVHPGSLIRVNDDGTVPQDNPFVKTKNARPEIYTYGNRNIQGLALQPETSLIWAHEHGPQGGDEVNIMTAGSNYGWPVITYGVNYVIGTPIGEGTHKAGMAQPVHKWVPSIAPSGMAFYTGDVFPEWRGDLFVGSLKFGLLVRLEIEGDKVVQEERLLNGKFGRIRDVRLGPDGALYLLTDESNGKLLKLERGD